MRLNRSLFLLCKLYNDLKAEEMRRYTVEHKSTSLTMFRTFALSIRKRETSQTVHSQVVQNVGDRIYMSFRNFFEGRAKFPRWKKHFRYTSLTRTQSGFNLDPHRGLRLSRIGYVRIFVHRPLKGEVKRLSVKREADGWYATFVCELNPPAMIPPADIDSNRIRGADLGLNKFAVLDDATDFEHPRFMKESEERMKDLQRHSARKRKGSKRRRDLGRRLARLHLHVRRQRQDFQNKLIHEIFKEVEVLVLERLDIRRMKRNHNLAKAISDAAWGMFARKAVSKAESLGKYCIFVDPWGTSQFCHNCLNWVPKSLGKREHSCDNCGVIVSRDLNSALLIRRLGILSSPTPDGGLSLAEQRPLPSLREMASLSYEAGSRLP